MECLFIDCAAKHGYDLIRKYQIKNGQDQTGHHAHGNRVAHTSFCRCGIALSQIQAHIGTAAVTDHDGNGQCHHSQRKYDCIRRIAIRSQIAGIGDKDLIDLNFPMVSPSLKIEKWPNVAGFTPQATRFLLPFQKK